MRRLILRLAAALLSLAVPGLAHAQATSDPALLAELLRLNRAYIAAAKAGDIATMKLLATDDYVAVNPYYAYMLDGDDRFVAEQKAWAAYFASPNGDRTIVRTESGPIAKRFDADVAVLAYNELEASATAGKRVRAGRTGKCSFVYRRQNGRWLLANSIITEQAWPDRMAMGIRK